MVIHRDKLRWLLWLRWKTLTRSFRRSGRAGAIIGSIIQLLFIVLGGAGLAVGTFFAYRYVPAPINSEILFLVLTGIYLLWILAPVMQIANNEGLDVSKLTLFPLTRGELIASLLLSTVLDIMTIFIVMVMIGVVAGWAFSVPLALMAIVTMLVFYVQVIGMSQLVVALLSRLLQGRRLRDLGVIIAVLVGLSGYMCQFVAGRSGLGGAIVHGQLSPYLQWLPPGMAARAIQQAYVGNWEISLVWLLGLVLVTAVVLFLWQLVVERALTAPEVGGAVRTRRRKEQPAVLPVAEMPVATATASRRGFIPQQVWAITVKEYKAFRRDPQYLRLIMFPLAYVIVFSVSTILGLRNTSVTLNPNAYDSLAVVGLTLRFMITPAFVLLSLFTLSYNTLGFERQSLTTLFLFPVNPRYILWGKNLMLFFLGMVELVVVLLVIAFVSHVWIYTLPAFALGLAGIGVVLASGNVTSVFFPQQMRLMAQRGFQSSNNMSSQAGCLRVVMSFASMIVTLIVLLPVLAALIVPIFLHAIWFWIIGIPFALAYGAVIYFVITGVVAPRMLQRTPEILAVVAKE